MRGTLTGLFAGIAVAALIVASVVRKVAAKR